jgi:gluconolactonase
MRRAWVLLAAACALGAENAIVPEGAKVEKVWGEGEFTEGPAYGPDGWVYFADIGNRILKYDPASGRTTEYRNPSGRANGLDFDPEGRLVAAEGANTGGNRRVTRTEKDGKVRVLADRWKGKRFNSPNDLTIDTKGASTSPTRATSATSRARSTPRASTASTPTARLPRSSPTCRSPTGSCCRRT